METETIAHGETYAISITAKDSDGVAMTLTGGWTAACRVCKHNVGGATALDVTMTITGGTASGSFDSEVLARGKYYLDVRFTDPDGNDYWSAPWAMEINARNTPPSA